MKALTITLATMLITGFAVISFAFGCIDEAMGDGCALESVASYTPTYQLGCAFFKRRWNPKYPNRPNGYCDPSAGECDTGDDDDDDYDPTKD